jgi:geranylgeranyl diphosphate synthase type 3
MCLGLITERDMKPRLIWPALFNTKYEVFVHKEKYCVRSFMLQLCITLHCRIDDIQDNSFLRRGISAAHKVYGVARTISAAMCVYFISLQKALSSNHSDMIKLYTEMNLDLRRGQEMEIYWRDNHTCPSEEEYLEMVKRSMYRVRTMSKI